MPIGSNGQTIIAPRQPGISAPFPGQHSPLIPDKSLALRGRIAKGILHQSDVALNLSTGGLWQIRTAIIDNITNQYLWIAEAQRFVRPWCVNMVLPLEGVGQLAVSFLAPLGIVQAAFSGATPDSVYVTALENRWPPDAGVSYQAL